MNTQVSFRKCVSPTVTAALVALCILPLQALQAQPADGTVDLLATPPEITSSVSPNLMISFDDSGSMGRNFMPDQRPFTGAGWGATDQQNFLGSAEIRTGPYACANVLDPRETDPTGVRARSMNGVYYNPNATYRPPLRSDGVTHFPDAPYSAAWDNGIAHNHPTNGAGTSQTRDLATGTRFCGNAAGYYRLRDTVTLNLDANGNITNTGDVYTAANWEWVPLPAAEQQNFANWYSYYHTRSQAARSAFSLAMAPFDQNIRIAWQNFNSNQLAPATAIFKFADLPINANVRKRFYDWLFTHPVGGGTPNQATTVRAGNFFTRQGGAVDTNPYWDRDLNRELSCRQNFHLNITDGLWNGAVQTTATNEWEPASQTLPDGRVYSNAYPESKIFWNEGSHTNRTMADIAWHYWRTDLRPDFAGAASTRLKVPPFIPDRSTNMFGTPIGAGQDPRSNREVYWNPVNDPASWPHLVQFFISFGVDGTIPRTSANFINLREGDIAWPTVDSGVDDRRKIDDIWHAALNSRGKFFSTANPEQLITSLNEIIASIIARRGASTAVSVSLPIITDGTTGYTAGYDTTDWSGFVTRNRLDLITAERVEVLWDAACLLTGGSCPSTAQTGLPVRDPDTREIITSDGVPGSARAFRWDDLSSQQKARMNVDPTTIRLDLGTWTADTFGDERVDYLRGERANESTASPRFRMRSSVLGAVIRGQPIYVSSPTAGRPDAFPGGSPEELARLAGYSYARFQNDNRSRAPTVYVGANDGMLHAFNGTTGRERFAYVPNTVIENFRLTKSTQAESGLTPTVDDKPLVSDVFINGSWRTVLVGSLRLGGRGVYALDISNPTGVSEDTPNALPLWEFSNVPPPGNTSTDCSPGSRHCSSLGYTYESVNIARIKHDNKWVALVSSGYFPTDTLDPASTSTAASRTSLLVIDLETGTLIREILTSSAPQTATESFGLSQAIVLDDGTDQIDDVAIAGDLAGNLWRFDLSGDNPSDWKVDLIFKTYGNGGAAAVGDQPIASAPVVMATPNRRSPIFVFGTGKFIGAPDRLASIPQQSFYGIRDYGACDPVDNPEACSIYPIQADDLFVQRLTQTGAGIRAVITSTEPVPTDVRGWRIRLNIPTEPGERSYATPFPFYGSNQVLLRSIIPKGVDPCDPGARFGLMVVNAGDGSAYVDPTDSSPSRLVGGVISSSTPPGDPITLRGGGNVVIAGLTERDGTGTVINQAVVNAINTSLSRADDIWHRGAWREILDQ